MKFERLNNDAETNSNGRLNEYYKIRIGGYIGKIKIKTKTVLKK